MNSRFLAELPLFRGLDEAARERLEHLAVEKTAARDETIFRHGDPPEAFFIVRTGSVALYRDQVGKPVQLFGRARAGEWFGEMGLFEDQPRSASARATEDSRLLVFPREALLRFLEGHPQLELRLQFAAAQRHHENVSAALDLSTTKEVRMRVDREAILEVDGARTPVHVENLSIGGVSLDRIPAGWRVGQQHRVALVHGERRLEAEARISWTSRSQAGLSFVDPGPDHELEVLRMIRALLASDAF